MRLACLLAVAVTLAFSAAPASADQIVGLAGKCLNVSGANSADGTPIILYRCEGYDNEEWEFRNGRIIGLDGKCLNVEGENSADGARIILWPCENRPNDRWSVRR